MLHMFHDNPHEISWQDLKILLIKMDMTVTDLAHEIDCARSSIYLAFSRRNRPGVMRKIRDFYKTHNAEFA